MRKQKFITKEIEKQLLKSPLYSTDGNPQAKSICKFFNPYGLGTWYVFEGNKLENGDWEFYGVVDLWEKELGYFTLSQLEEIRVNVLGHKLPLEREIYHTPMTKEELLKS